MRIELFNGEVRLIRDGVVLFSSRSKKLIKAFKPIVGINLTKKQALKVEARFILSNYEVSFDHFCKFSKIKQTLLSRAMSLKNMKNSEEYLENVLDLAREVALNREDGKPVISKNWDGVKNDQP